MNKLKVLELFAGIGSQAKALRNLGIEFESDICEFDDKAVASYNAIHGGGSHNYGDITKTHIDKQYDLWTYSFPCQDLSSAGKGAGIKQGTRSGLLYEVQRLLEECSELNILPETLLMENVPGLLFKSNIGAFEDWISFLESLGYTNSYDIVNSLDFGVPQQRKRVFMVSSLSNKTPFDFSKLQKVSVATLKDFISFDDMRPLTSNDIERISKWNAYEKPLNKVVTMNDYLGTITTRSCWNTSSMKLVENDNGEIFCLQSKGAFTLMGFDNEDWERASQVNNE
jgi:DNA (cytosine-5)-methyltransferase 1